MKRIVVLGGGFGGVAAAQRLDRRFRYDDEIEIEVVSDTNYVVYTPMLADVAGGTIEPRHAVPPVRAFLKKAHFREATVRGIDVANQTVHGTLIDGTSAELRYDYLVIALGAITNYAHATGAAEHTVGLKDLFDAVRVRNRALTLLEWANTTRDPELRRELLTFVMAGGGFSGVEGIAALEDLLHGALRYYHGISPDELRFILAPHGKRLLEEVDPRLGEYVVEKFSQRTIDVRLGVGVTDVTARSATLTTGEVIPTRMVIWTAGIKVNPVLHDVNLPKDKHGALLVNDQLQVLDHPAIFALGDCAAVPTPDGQGFYAPTAQNAIREGPVAAANIIAAIRNTGLTRTFAYKPVGSLASLGQRQAVAQIGDLRLSGLPAWFAWRGIYLAKLPTLADKVRVGLDWLTDLFAPVDTVQLPIIRENLSALTAILSADAMPPASLPNAPAALSPSAPVAG
ncbi:MAG TPA: NAD(P)/FAD-dependent oxidoreductase [Ktedonobacterales bacterium]|nr:NAD(P)/FAD-dependent oxidoreductase [Ktedonobacterales bacterium]